MYELIYKEIGFGQAVGFSFLIGRILIALAFIIFLIRRKFRFNFKAHILFQGIFLGVTVVAMSTFRIFLGFKQGSSIDSLLEAIRLFGGALGASTMALGTGLLADSIILDSLEKRRTRIGCAVITITLHLVALFCWINYEYDKYGFGRAGQAKPKRNIYETAAYKAREAYFDYNYYTASNFRKEFTRLVNEEKYDGAIHYLNSILEGPAPRNSALGRAVVNMTGNALVKTLYRQGKFREAIMERRKSLALNGHSQFNENEIVELWQLQDMYRKKIGETAFQADKQVSEETIGLDPEVEKLQLDYINEAFTSDDKLEVEKADFLSNYYFMHLYFEKAETECKRGIDAFNRLRKRFQTKDYEHMKGRLELRLLSILAMQGKFDEALTAIRELKKSYSDNGLRVLNQIEKTLKEAKHKALKPSDIAYPQLDNAANPDMGFYIRDKTFNRLESNEPQTTDWVVVKHVQE